MDLLANQGVSYVDNRFTIKWQEVPQHNLKAKCQDQAEEDWLVFPSRAMEDSIDNS